MDCAIKLNSLSNVKKIIQSDKNFNYQPCFNDIIKNNKVKIYNYFIEENILPNKNGFYQINYKTDLNIIKSLHSLGYKFDKNFKILLPTSRLLDSTNQDNKCLAMKDHLELNSLYQICTNKKNTHVISIEFVRDKCLYCLNPMNSTIFINN